MNKVSTSAANIMLMLIIIAFILAGVRKKINVYDAFIEGAKEGFTTAVRIIPYLVAILVGIGVFRASGAMDMLIDGIKYGVEACGGNTDFVGALPTALMKPLSGSGARGMMVDAMTTYGADSFVGRLSCIFQGSTDTTFYILAVYFGMRIACRFGWHHCSHRNSILILWINNGKSEIISKRHGYLWPFEHRWQILELSACTTLYSLYAQGFGRLWH